MPFYQITQDKISARVRLTTNGNIQRIPGISVSKIGQSIMPLLPPNPPTNIKVYGYDKEVLVQWDRPYDNGSDIIKYKVVCSNGYVLYTLFDIPSLNFKSSIVNGQNYTFKVSAINAGGESVYSPLSVVITPQGWPPAVTNVVAIGGDGEATISFTPAVGAEGVVLNYTAITSDFSHRTDVGVASGPITITGLTNGESYTFKIYSWYFESGHGTESVESNLVLIGLPDPPQFVIADAGDSEVTLYWSPGNNNSTFPSIRYDVTCSNGQSYIDASSPLVFTKNIVNGTSYTFTITATNYIGTSVNSEISNGIIPGILPDPPTNIIAVPGNGKVSLSWTPPIKQGDSSLKYHVLCIRLSDSQGVDAYNNISSTSCEFIKSIVNGIGYYFKVLAYNDIGPSLFSESSNTVIPKSSKYSYSTAGAPNSSFSALKAAGLTHILVQANWSILQPGAAGSALNVTELNNLKAVFTAANAAGLRVTLEHAFQYAPAFALALEQFKDQKGFSWTDASTADGAGIRNWMWTTLGRTYIADFYTKVAAGLGPTNMAMVDMIRIGGGMYGELHYPISIAPGSSATPYSFYAYGASMQAGTGLASGLTICPHPGYVIWSGNAVYDADIIAWYINGLSDWQKWQSAQLKLVGWTCPLMVLHPGYGVRSNQLVTENSYRQSVAAGEDANIIMAGYADDPQTWPWCTWIDGPDGWTPPGADSDYASWKKLYSLAVIYDKTAKIGGENTANDVPNSVMNNVFANALSSGGNIPAGIPQDVLAERYFGYTDMMWMDYSGLIAGGAKATLTNYGIDIISHPTNVLVPNAPTNVVAIPGDKKVTLSFTSPVDNGSLITSYKVFWNYTELTSGGSPIVISNLTNGISYRFRVKAVSSQGEGPASLESSAVTPATVPDAPTNVVAVGGNHQATVSWTAPVNDGGSPITHYHVQSSGPYGVDTASPVTSGLLNSLDNGTSYTFTVTAVNSMGISVSSTVSNTVIPIGPPDPPTNVVGVAGNGQVIVSWTAPINDGGSPITYYHVQSDRGPGVNTASPVTSGLVNSITNGLAYIFTVTAINSLGTSGSSTPSSPITPATIPNPPINVVAVGYGGYILVSWAPPVNNGGSPITGYKIECSNGNGVYNIMSSFPFSSGLIIGTSYTFTIKATNSMGDSVSSSISNSAKLISVPTAPTNVVAVSRNSQAIISWDPPSTDGGAPIIDYYINVSSGGSFSASSSPMFFSFLVNGNSYTFTVAARNSKGVGPQSLPSNAVIPATVPNAPTNVVAVAGDGKLTVSWNPPVDNGGSPILSYQVYVNNIYKGIGTSPYLVPGLTNGVAYTVKIYPVNSVGQGASSVASNSVIPYRLIVALDSDTSIAASSPDGITWTQRSLSGALYMSLIAYGNGVFVAIGSGGAIGAISATSSDGINWTQRTLPTGGNWRAITYGNGVFVIVSVTSPTGLTSTDGINWTQRTLPGAQWRALAYGNGVFVAITYNDYRIATSSDGGVTWTQRALPVAIDRHSIAYGNGVFVTLSYGYIAVSTSWDGGVSWTQGVIAQGLWHSIAYGNGVFVAIAFGGAMSATSSDGLNWTQRTLPFGANWESITFANGLFVAVCTDWYIAITSTDGINWTQRLLPATAYWISVV